MTELFIPIDAIASDLSTKELREIFENMYRSNNDFAEWLVNDSKYKNADFTDKRVLVDIMKAVGVQFYFNISSKQIIEAAFYV